MSDGHRILGSALRRFLAGAVGAVPATVLAAPILLLFPFVAGKVVISFPEGGLGDFLGGLGLLAWGCAALWGTCSLWASVLEPGSLSEPEALGLVAGIVAMLVALGMPDQTFIHSPFGTWLILGPLVIGVAELLLWAISNKSRVWSVQ